MPDLFTSDQFSLTSLTAAINKVPVKPSRLAQLQIFEEEGIATTDCSIEFKDNQITLLPATTRGAPATLHPAGRGRKLVEFKVPHLITRSTLLADSIQNVRAFGNGELVAMDNAINERLSGMRDNLDATVEYHRMGAIKGVVLDANGSILFDTFAEFDVSPQSHCLELDVSATNVRNQIVAARRKAEARLGSAKPVQWIALSSAGFFDMLVSHASVEAFVAGWSAASMLREDVRDAVSIGGVTFEEYPAKVGNTAFIAEGEAYLIPVGVPGLFITRYAPADYAETVNTLGIPYYAKSEPMSFGRGSRMEAQSNPISLCTRPDAIIKLTASKEATHA